MTKSRYLKIFNSEYLIKFLRYGYTFWHVIITLIGFKITLSNIRSLIAPLLISRGALSPPLPHRVFVAISDLGFKRVNDQRVQKSAMKIILGKNYISCRQSHLKLCILSLSERREEPCLQFALKCTKNPRTQTTFLQNKKIHKMGIRNQETYISNHANTERLRQFSILYMQNLLNQMQRRFRNTA